MNAKELTEGREYWYTAGVEWVKVVYKHETINGYLFTYNGIDGELHAQAVKSYIEEIEL